MRRIPVLVGVVVPRIDDIPLPSVVVIWTPPVDVCLPNRKIKHREKLQGKNKSEFNENKQNKLYSWKSQRLSRWQKSYPYKNSTRVSYIWFFYVWFRRFIYEPPKIIHQFPTCQGNSYMKLTCEIFVRASHVNFIYELPWNVGNWCMILGGSYIKNVESLTFSLSPLLADKNTRVSKFYSICPILLPSWEWVCFRLRGCRRSCPRCRFRREIRPRPRPSKWLRPPVLPLAPKIPVLPETLIDRDLSF